MLEYAEDLKLISDLIKASLIDDVFTSKKFEKPGIRRIITMPRSTVGTGQPFYLYHEVYNLVVNEKGNHQIRTSYRIIEITTLKEQVVDFVEHIQENPGATACVGVKYHPMNLASGKYLIIAETQDLISGRTVTAACDFELK